MSYHAVVCWEGGAVCHSSGPGLRWTCPDWSACNATLPAYWGVLLVLPWVHSVIWNRQLIMQSRWWPVVDMSYMRVWVGSEKDSWQCIVLISPSAILHWKSTRWKVSRGKLCLEKREKCSLKHACGGGQCDREASCVTRGAIKSLTAPVAASVAFLLVQLTFGAVASILKRLTWQLRMTTMHKIRLQVLPCGHFLS